MGTIRKHSIHYMSLALSRSPAVGKGVKLCCLGSKFLQFRRQTCKCRLAWLVPQTYTLSPKIMEVENSYIWKVTTIGGPFSTSMIMGGSVFEGLTFWFWLWLFSRAVINRTKIYTSSLEVQGGTEGSCIFTANDGGVAMWNCWSHACWFLRPMLLSEAWKKLQSPRTSNCWIGLEIGWCWGVCFMSS